MLLRLAYLGVTNAFAILRLLPMSDRDKDMEILSLRHQITVLQRQMGKADSLGLGMWREKGEEFRQLSAGVCDHSG